jgi:hypothetical protein
MQKITKFRLGQGTATGDKAKTAIALESGLVRCARARLPCLLSHQLGGRAAAALSLRQVKSGYLVKRAKNSQSNWKKRFQA